MVRGFVELEAAKAVLLDELTAGLATGLGADEVLPALRRLEEFRNSLCQVDHVLVAAVQRFGLAEQQCVSSAEKLIAQVLQISVGEAKRRVRAAAGVGARYAMAGERLPAVRPVLAAAQAVGRVGPVAVDLIERALATVELPRPRRRGGDRGGAGRLRAGVRADGAATSV